MCHSLKVKYEPINARQQSHRSFAVTDKKVYNTDYQSEFTQFFTEANIQVDNVAVDAEKEKYARVFDLRDKEKKKTKRLKLWENF